MPVRLSRHPRTIDFTVIVQTRRKEGKNHEKLIFYTYFANLIFRFATKPHTSYPILSEPRTWVAELIVRVGGSLVLIHVFAVFGGEAECGGSNGSRTHDL